RVDTPRLKYAALNQFDADMQSLDQRFHVLTDPLIEELHVDEAAKQLVYRREPLVFAFNFHPTESYPGLRIPVPDPVDYVVVLNTDSRRFAGPGRSDDQAAYPLQKAPYHGRAQSIQLYLPSRSAQVLAPAGLEPGQEEC